ncbi:GNAT family N-acetyltransferase [Alkalicoccus halolimnae]|uniref:GNAT family N-acetyltransferase n=1 Tax=Alkalicoccus halolimnae TaxID=1667239 RepID=A0A5C7FBE7_9BACI|nr:GNAT family N-acetyltransferase [Alkalicoccus halolimnae]TXF81437.1 GNAT family N-acetyltransferase [Alkalicoccus halolimnae]
MIEVKELHPIHAEELLELRLLGLQEAPEAFSSSFKEEKDKTAEQTAERLLSSHAKTLGAFSNSVLTGTVTVVKGSKIKTKHKAEIVAVYVCKNKRNQGIGRKLLEEAVQFAADDPDIEKLYLTVTSRNRAAQNLYQTLGFSDYGKDEKGLKIDGNYIEELFMALDL